MGSGLLQAGRGGQSQHLRALIVMVLHHQQPARSQGRGGTGHDHPQTGQAIGAAIEGEVGFMVTHHRIEGSNGGGGNVGRVGHRQLQGAPLGLQALPPLAVEQAHRGRGGSLGCGG